jgi:UDP-N-acetylmuramyl pentapeptide synthase
MFREGAVAAVVDREVESAGVTFRVADVLEGLQRLGGAGQEKVER